MRSSLYGACMSIISCRFEFIAAEDAVYVNTVIIIHICVVYNVVREQG